MLANKRAVIAEGLSVSRQLSDEQGEQMAAESKHRTHHNPHQEVRRVSQLSPATERAHLDVQSVSETDDLRALYEAPEGRTRAEHAGYLNSFNQSARDLYERGAGVYGDVFIIPREASGQAQGADEIRLGRLEHAVKNFSRFIRDPQELVEKASEFVQLGKQIAGRTADSHTRLVVFREFYDRVTKTAEGKYRPPQEQRETLDGTLAEMRSLASAMREEEWRDDQHIGYEEIDSWERNLTARQRDAESETHGRLTGRIEGQGAGTEEEHERAEEERERAGFVMSGEHTSVRLDLLPPVLPASFSATEREKLFTESLPRIDSLLERGVAPRSLIQTLNREYRKEELQARDAEVMRRVHGHLTGAIAEPTTAAVTRQEQLRALLTVRTLANVAHRKEESRFSRQAWEAMREYYSASPPTPTTLHERDSLRRNPHGGLSEPPAVTIARLEITGMATSSANSRQVRGGVPNFALSNLANRVPSRADVERLETLKRAVAHVDAEISRRGFSIQERARWQQAIEQRLAVGSPSQASGRKVHVSFSPNERTRLPVETYNEYKTLTTTAERLGLPFHTYGGPNQEEITGYSAEREQIYAYQKEYVGFRMQDEETRMLNQNPLYRDFSRRLNNARDIDELRKAANEIRRENYDREHEPHKYKGDWETAAGRGREPSFRPLTEQQMRALFLTPPPAHYTEEMRRFRHERSISGEAREQKIRQLERGQLEPSPGLEKLLGEFARTRSDNRAQHIRNINLFIADLINPPRPDRQRFSRLDLYAEHVRLAPDERNFLFRAITDTKSRLKTDAPLRVRERVLQIEQGRESQPNLEQPLRVPTDSRSFRLYTGAAAWREAEQLTDAIQFPSDKSGLHRVDRQSIMEGISDRRLETVVTLLRNFKSNQLEASAEHLRSLETSELRQVGEIVSTFKDMKRTTDSQGQLQYQITIPENSELTREDWRQLLDYLQPRLSEEKTSLRDMIPTAQAREIRRLALAEGWTALDPANHQQLGQSFDESSAATLDLIDGVRREIDRARELQKRVAVAHQTQEQAPTTTNSEGTDASHNIISDKEQSKAQMIRTYTRRIKGEYLAAFPRIDEATQTFERARVAMIEAREASQTKERSESFQEVRGQLEQRVGDYLKTVLREHGENTFEPGRGGADHTHMVAKLMREVFDERGVTIENVNLNEAHIERASHNIVSELSRALQYNREQDKLFNENLLMPAGTTRIEDPHSDHAHGFTGNDLHIRVPEKSEIESLERTASIEEIHRQQITTLDIDDEFVEEKIGAQFDRVNGDALSRSPNPFATTRSSPSHQPAREHTASQEQVRQYTLTR